MRIQAAVLTSLLLACPALAADHAVLFVGNSFTFVNDLPAQISHVARSFGDKLVYNSSTIGGYVPAWPAASR